MLCLNGAWVEKKHHFYKLFSLFNECFSGSTKNTFLCEVYAKQGAMELVGYMLDFLGTKIGSMSIPTYLDRLPKGVQDWNIQIVFLSC